MFPGRGRWPRASRARDLAFKEFLDFLRGDRPSFGAQAALGISQPSCSWAATPPLVVEEVASDADGWASSNEYEKLWGPLSGSRAAVGRSVASTRRGDFGSDRVLVL